MKEIQLTKGYFAKVDDSDYDVLKKYRWSATENGSSVYAKMGFGPRRRVVKIYMHRLILGIDDPKILCDHKDRDSLNNQRNNLRVCTKKQNNSNRRPTLNSTSKYMGVCRAKHKKWRAYIRPETGQINKLFDSEIDAAKWYNEQATKYFGEFAYQNAV